MSEEPVRATDERAAGVLSQFTKLSGWPARCCRFRYTSGTAVAEFIPLNEFQLNWRFTDPRYNVLPAAVLDRIKAFGPKTARDVWHRVAPLFDNYAIRAEFFERVIPFDCSGEVVEARSWLVEQFPEHEQNVMITWAPEVAASVVLRDFCEYWDDFCYSNSDDVVVFPAGEDWVLYYMHEEVFYLGYKSV